MSNFNQIYHDLLRHGQRVRPRGQLVLELEDYAYQLDPYERFASYPSRKLNLGYIQTELRWYLRGDLADLSICDHAKIWQACVTDDRLNSNYGHYVFQQGGLDFVVDELRRDRDSRRACITILAQEHLYDGNRDVPCTAYLNFRVRAGKLNLSVHMRSQDAIYGLGNDAPFFSLVHEMAYVYLREVYPDLTLGHYHHTCDSLHVYARHFELLTVLGDGVELPTPVDCPLLEDAQEVDDLRLGIYDGDRAFSRWLSGAVLDE